MTGCAAGMMISSDELFRRRAKVRRCACGPNDRDTGDTLRRSHAFSIDDDDIHSCAGPQVDTWMELHLVRV